MFCKKSFPTRKHRWKSFFSIKFWAWRPVTLFKKTQTQVFSCEIFEYFKNTYFEEHLGTTASERLRKISPLLVLGNAVLDGKRHNWATIMLFIKNMNLMKLVCVIFTLILSSRNNLSRKYPPPMHISPLSPLTSILAYISPLKKAFEKCKPVSLFSRFYGTSF